MNKKGQNPIKCRLTFLKTRKEFSTGIFINPDYWDSSKQKSSPLSTDNATLNNKLSCITDRYRFLMLQTLPSEFDVDDMYQKYKGEDSKEEITILGAYDLHNDEKKNIINYQYSLNRNT